MNFTDLNLNKPLLNALADMQFETPTEIQEKSFSQIMSGKDTIGIAQTGTGKTFAYLLPLIRLWQYNKQKNPQIMVLVPTRELVVQVKNAADQLSTYLSFDTVAIFGGKNIKEDIKALNAGVDLVVATPGRLIELAMTRNIKLTGVKKLVIDEVDEMFHLGFQKQLLEILDLLPKKRQNIMFSATLIESVEEFIKAHFLLADKITTKEKGQVLDLINQKFIAVPNYNTKINYLKWFLSTEDAQKVLVFCSTKKLAKQVYETLEELKESNLITSNKDQNARLRIVEEFRNGDIKFLVATDLVARGIDIDNISHVINFDLPSLPESYIHRIGRTGRAGTLGEAISLVSEFEETEFEALQEHLAKDIELIDLDDNVEINEEKADFEMERLFMPTVEHKNPKNLDVGPAFHEKKAKNQKENNKIRYADKMKEKYKKPKTRKGKH